MTPSESYSAVVHVERCESYQRAAVEAAVARLLEPLGGMGAFVKPGQRVLLKPNLIVPRPVQAAVITHPEVIRAVAALALEAGGRVAIGDSPAFHSARVVARVGGITAVARELGVPIVDLRHRSRLRTIDEGGPFPRVSFSADALESDVIINLPKVKAHTQVRLSLGVKNMFGCVAGKRKALLHFRNGPHPARFGRMLAAVCRFLKPSLTLADGIVALERSGPIHGDPRPLGLLAASIDPVALDTVLAHALGVRPEDIIYLEGAREIGYGCGDLACIAVEDGGVEMLANLEFRNVERTSPIEFTLPRVLRSVGRQIYYLARSALSRPFES